MEDSGLQPSSSDSKLYSSNSGIHVWFLKTMDDIKHTLLLYKESEKY